MVEGQVDTLRTGQYDASRMASELEKQGISGENAFIMRQAAVHYRNADNHVAAELCETRALLFEEKYSEAARAFFKQQRWEDATHAYWMDGANGRRELWQVGREEEEIRKRLEWRLADALNNNTSGIQLWNDLFEEVVRHARKERSNWNPELRKGWSDSILSAVARVVANKKEVAKTDQWLEIVHRINDLDKLGLCSVMPIDHAVLAARAGQYPTARKHFIEAGLDEASIDGQPTEFLETVSKCLPWPKNLRALELLGQRAAIIREWEANPAVLQVAADVAAVANCLIREGRESDALPLAVSTGKSDLTSKCAENFLHRGDSQNAHRSLICTLLLLVRSGSYGELLRFRKSPITGADGRQHTLLELLGDTFPRWLARALAAGEPVNDPSIGPKIADILKEGTPSVNPASEADVRLWGAALERTGQINPVIEFYEGILPRCPVEAAYQELRLWVRGRLLKAKWKRTLTAGAKKHMEATRTDQIGIRNELEKWKLGTPESLPDFPDRVSIQKILEELMSPAWKDESTEEPVVAEPPLPTPTPVVVAAPQTVPEVEKVQFLGFDFQINRAKKRLTITRPPDDNRVRIEAGSGNECDSDLPTEQVGEANWKIPEWGIRAELIENAERPQVIVRWQEQGVELRFDLP
jgi:hypothetical protein